MVRRIVLIVILVTCCGKRARKNFKFFDELPPTVEDTRWTLHFWQTMLHTC
jgi:hypothetical protein